ncbi:glycosyltransferase family 4 protein [Hymenobacter cellulosilyticus]|uniref:Glycosyltransferase family 4 protein n=1 Tax=Hymenobacter cellulosilyticus TaxID=2932248 RepID=A0A8T9PXN6_9BACT|nr:glycosyltransferase family 1 protein [Hymenobacter cellulosilyticus]UOQ70034.1 glycosyltransferase family 4 protein [Hymenobacter cellulosilyticus]
MNILYDHQAFTVQDVGGVSRYYRALLDHAAPDIHSHVPVVLSNNVYLKDRQHSRHSSFFPNLSFRGRFSLMLSLNRSASRRALRQGKFDVFHPTLTDDPYFLPEIQDKPLVITIHDMIPVLFGEQYPLTDLPLMSRIAQRANQIIAVSEHTRADILRLLPVSPDRVTVVPHGYTPAIAGPATLPEGYLLYVGTRQGYKNFDCLLQALAQLVRQPGQRSLRLVCAGGGWATEAEQDRLQVLGLTANVQFAGLVSEAELASLYRGAAAFVFPSCYEGFGFPILEAFAQHCPVVLSNASCFPETAQDAALYFDPQQPADLAQQLLLLLREPHLRRQLTQLGSLRLRDFTWGQTAALTHEVYRAAQEQPQPVLI